MPRAKTIKYPHFQPDFVIEIDIILIFIGNSDKINLET
jgi:hypothetical protein